MEMGSPMVQDPKGVENLCQIFVEAQHSLLDMVANLMEGKEEVQEEW